MVDLLLSAFSRSPLGITQEQAQKMERYHTLLMEANKVMNLTAIQSEQEAAILHYLDSASPLFFGYLQQSDRCCDVGSGAGFPGIVLAILKPDCRFVLLDSLQKRVQFLQRTAEELSLGNVEAQHFRAEDAGRDSRHRERYDVVLARAVAPLNILCEYCLPLVRVGGHMIAYKGAGAMEEVSGAVHAMKVLGSADATIVDARIPEREHRLIRLQKLHKTPSAYPRKAGTPTKQPL